MWWGGDNRGSQTQYQNYPEPSAELAAWPAMSYEDISSWVCGQSPAALRGQGTCLWHSFLRCRNSENFLDRPSLIFASSSESLLSPPAPAEAWGGSRRSQWAMAG